MNLHEIAQLRREGRYEESYAACKELLAADPGNPYFRTSLAACIKKLLDCAVNDHDARRFLQLMEELTTLHLEEDPGYHWGNRIAWPVMHLFSSMKERNISRAAMAARLLPLLKKLTYCRPNRYYSILLEAFCGVRDDCGRAWPQFVDFVDWWGLENLRPEDFARRQLDGGRSLTSLAEKVYTAYYKSFMAVYEDSPVPDHEAAERMIGILTEAHDQHPGFFFLRYYIGMLRLALGNKGEAKEHLRYYLQRRPGQYWGWTGLAEALDDPSQKLACYCRALVCKADAGFMGRTRVKTAQTMLQLGMKAAAKCELENVATLYNRRHWHLSPEAEEMMRADWYAATEAAPDNEALYQENLRQADAIVIGDIKETPVMVNYFNADKGVCYFFTDKGVRSHFYIRDKSMRFGRYELLMVKFAEPPCENKLVKVLEVRRMEDPAKYEGIFFRHACGQLRVNDRGYGFVDDLFIPESDIRGRFKAGDWLKVTSVPAYNPSKVQWNWKAVKIRLMTDEERASCQQSSDQ